jgi:hypothetical protein
MARSQGPAVFASASPLRELAYCVVYPLGPGSLLLALGGFALGRPKLNAIDLS